MLYKFLKTPWQILAVILLVIFSVEAVVMLLLPWLISDRSNERVRALVDAAVLTVLSAPILWWIIIRPLRRIAINEQARSETIVANAGDGIVTLTAEGRIISANYAAGQLFGHSPEQLVGTEVQRILPELSLHPTPVGQTVQVDGVRRDGSRFPLALSLSQLPLGRAQLFVGIARDLTDAKRAEEERTAAAREKEGLRAQQMATLAQLATGVAHEIRNPLTSIKLLVQANRARLEASGLPSEDLELVEQEIRRMERSVNSLLEFARPARPERVTTSLQDVVQRTRALVEGRAAKQRVVTDVDAPLDPVQVFADPEQLQQLLLNLELNALDAMPEGGTLKVEIIDEGDDVVISVRDTGPGIDANVMEDLFRPFVTTKKSGIGLGLGICRRIAEDHGGSLSAKNHPDGGAQFELRLPKHS